MTLPSRNLLFARIYYFTFMGGWGFVLPFMNLFFVSLGFSGQQIGLIASVSALVGMVASPIWVSEVKKHQHARRFLQAAILLGAIGYFLIGNQKEFPFILLLVFLHSLAASGIIPLSDSMAVTVAQEAETGYGSVRAWASLGWIISVLTSGWLLERFGYIAAFIGVTSMWTFASAVVTFIQPHHFTLRRSPTLPQTNLKLAVQRVIHNRTLWGLALVLVLVGFLNSGVLQFENVFLEELGASKRLISVAGILSALVELPFMIYADRIVRRVGGHRLLLVALSFTLLQRIIVFLLPFIPTILIIRFVGGVAFSFYTIAFVNLISTQTDPSETGTVLALYTVTIGGLVNMIAAPVAGTIFDAIGAHWLYLLSAGGYLIGIVSLWLTKPQRKAD
ncbi:MAG TPA: MFS transporter [Anaerolineales bacterium]|nr:MFS transporter [Anaerolineales bacterium]